MKTYEEFLDAMRVKLWGGIIDDPQSRILYALYKVLKEESSL